MGNQSDPFLAVDREHERQEEADDDYKKHLAAETKRHAAAMRTNVLTGHQQTLEALAHSLSIKISAEGIMEHLIRAALSCGPLLAGQMLIDLIDNCIEDDAETAALVEMDRAERAGGLDFVAMRAVAPQEVVVPA